MIEWCIVARCPCSNVLLMPESGIDMSLPDCDRCGLPRTYWRLEKARWVSTSHWWWPWSWGNGYWEYDWEGW